MRLPTERVGPYVRALASGLNQLAPHGAFVPLMESLAHLRALDPLLSGELLFPAEVHDPSGMPSYAWMQRVSSEAQLARRSSAPTEAQIARADRLDPELAQRLLCRRALWAHLSSEAVLPATRLACALRRVEPQPEVEISYDRLAPDGRWLRICAVIRVASGVRRFGPFSILNDTALKVDDGLQHLLTRHFLTTLMGLHSQLEEVVGASVVRLSRGWVGPFWFPGVVLPERAPAVLGRGLLVQLSSEVVAEDVHHRVLADPLWEGMEERAPAGQKIFRERRFAVSPNIHTSLVEWCEQIGMRCPIVSIDGRRTRRDL